MRHQSYQRAIITGASSGLGEEFAYQLAPYVDELILIARRRDRLTIVGESSRRINPALQVSCLPGDLTDPSFICSPDCRQQEPSSLIMPAWEITGNSPQLTGTR